MHKKILYLFIVLNSITSLSQESNIYHFQNDKFEVKEISLEKYSSVIIRRDGQKILTGIIIRKYNKNNCELIKLYDRNNESYKDEKYIITPEMFDNIAKDLDSIDVHKINSLDNSNIYDGTHYTLKFRDYNYTVQLYSNTPEISTKERGLEEFLALSKKIWNLSSIEKKK